ncbi:MAG: iron-containing alcohol dehydrogenase, partial [Gemmatimonadaceae bacterium]
ALPRAYQNGNDLDARGKMLVAAAMGAVAFQKDLGVVHSLAHPLSSEKNLHHGLANALCLPAVVDFNNAVVPERIERIRRLTDLTATSLSNALRSLREKIGLPNGLGAEGVTKADLPKLADKAMEDACHRLNPRPCTRDDMLKLYETSL